MRSPVLLCVLAITLPACGEPPQSPLDSHPRFAPGELAGAIPFEAWGVDCGGGSSVPEDVRLTDGVLHLVRLHNEGSLYSTNPLLDGWVTVDVSVTINTKTGAGSYRGSVLVEPEGVAGTWVANFGGTIRGGRFDAEIGAYVGSHMIARGTGELAGLKLMFDHFVSDALVPPAAPDGCLLEAPYELWKGVILGA